jgi:hypothetical protein
MPDYEESTSCHYSVTPWSGDRGCRHHCRRRRARARLELRLVPPLEPCGNRRQAGSCRSAKKRVEGQNHDGLNRHRRRLSYQSVAGGIGTRIARASQNPGPLRRDCIRPHRSQTDPADLGHVLNATSRSEPVPAVVSEERNTAPRRASASGAPPFTGKRWWSGVGRTADLPFFRRIRAVARRCRLWPDMPLSCIDRG